MHSSIRRSHLLTSAVAGILAIVATLLPRAGAADATGTETASATGQTIRVSGAMFTNFITPTNTLGIVTGDLRGAVATSVLELDQAAGRGLIHHDLVLENGDQLFFKPAVLHFAPGSADPSLGWFHLSYTNIEINGGTGRFEGATGTSIVHGSVDFVKGQAVLRYSGTITLKAPTPAPASRLSAAGLKNGQFHLQVAAPAGRPVSAEVSEDLRNWNVLATQAAGSDPVEFVDPAAANSAQRFYRARTE